MKTLDELKEEYSELDKAINENVRAQRVIIAAELLTSLDLKIGGKITFGHDNILAVVAKIDFDYLTPLLKVKRIKHGFVLGYENIVYDYLTIKKVK